MPLMPITPGLSIPSYPTPQLADVALIEFHDPNAPLYRVMRLEESHPDTVLYPNHRLVFQAPVEGTDDSIRRIYVNDRTAQNTYNAETTYLGEANAFPVFKREYLERRATYAPLTKGLPLTGVVKAVVTAGGTGYEPSSANPSVTPTTATISGAGTGATAIPLVNDAGVITGVIILTEGTGYTGVPTIAFAGTGSGATGTVAIQPATALLVAEKQDNASQDLTSRYVMVTRVWMTLPGPPLTETKYDADSDTVYTVTRTQKLLSAITEGGFKVGSTAVTVESEPIDSLMGWEVVKTFPDAVANDLEHAITISEESAPYQFPATLDATQYTNSGGLVGYTKAFVRRVPHLTKVFWVVSDTKPSLATYVTPPAPATIFEYGGGSLGEVIYDAVTVIYTLVTVAYPGSTPDLTTYLADWVDQLKPVLGSIREAGSRFRWRVEVTYVTMLVPALPTYTL